MDHSAAGGDKCEFGTHGDTDLVRRKDPDANHHTGLIVPRSGLNHTGLVKWSVSATFVGSMRPSSLGTWIPAPKVVTIRATSISTEIATLGKIHANS